MIRRARPDDLDGLRDIERAAGSVFRGLGMDEIAEDEPPTVEELAAFQTDGRAWVAVDAADRPVAYLLVEPVDGNAHIEQVSVHPDHAGQGIGRDLLEVAADWARDHDLTGLTLTTFSHVPWNAPYYERIGFQTLGEHDVTEGLRAIREHEATLGLDRWPRMVMRRGLASRPVASPLRTMNAMNETADPAQTTPAGPELWVERTGTRRYVGHSSRGARVEVGSADVEGVFTPGELLKIALGACTAMSSDFTLSRRLGDDYAATVRVSGHADREVERYPLLEESYELDLSGLDPAMRERLLDMVRRSVDKACTVGRTLTAGTEIELGFDTGGGTA